MQAQKLELTIPVATPPEDNRWYTARQFYEAFPGDFRSLHVVRRLIHFRHENGLADCGAIVKKPGRHIMINRAKYLRWLTGESL